MPARPVHLTLAPLDVGLEDLSDRAQQTSRLTASVGFGGKGTIKVEGPVKLLRPALDLALSVESLDLPQLDPYLDLYGDLAARLGSGKLGLQGHARFDGGAEPATWSFEVDTRVAGLTLLDSQRNQELVRWKDLQISGIKTASDPLALSIRSVRWVQPNFRVALAEDGSSNLQRLLKAPPPRAERKEDRPAEEAKAEEAKPAEEEKPAEDRGTETTVKAPRQKPQPPVSLASFQIVRGAATFTDRSVTPPVTLSVTDLDVRLRGLSNALNARSQVQIKALVSGGPLEINGILSPRMVNDATDVKVSSKGIDLTPLSPYCGKYAGYALDKGKLDLALEYKVAKRRLAATNSVKIDQFTFGEATSSPDATKLPVKLGLAVLQDPNGLIDLDVPVEGNVDDPNFRLGRVVWRAIGNVLLKAVTSPFNLLAKLVGGGGGAEKLDVIDFQAGAADLTPSAEKSLQGLSKALASRPALKVDVEGIADPAADGKTLKLKELKRQAAAARAEKGQKGEMTDEEYVKFVEKRWRSLAPQNQSGTPPDPAAMEDAVLASVQLPPESLSALGQGRAEAARARLQALGVDPGRLFLTKGGERAKKEGGTRVYFTLK
jgi:flagellar motor protein MotB